MSVGLIGDGWWKSACQAAGESFVILPPAGKIEGNPYAADMPARSEAGPTWLDPLQGSDVDSASGGLDNGGTGLAYLPDPGNSGTMKMLHEAAGVPLASVNR